MKKLTLEVTGMKCEGCARAVEEAGYGAAPASR
jgi:copper chaperone CopZ